MDVLAGTDFFTVEVLTFKGLVTYYVLFFIQLETRRICLAGLTRDPDQEWMEQQARNITMKDWGFLAHSRYLLHDRDGKFCPVFREVIQAGKVKPLKLPARSPNLNAFAERWVRSVISTENGIIRAKATSCCFPHRADQSKAAVGEPCNAKHDSVAYCDTARPGQHEYWLGLLLF